MRVPKLSESQRYPGYPGASGSAIPVPGYAYPGTRGTREEGYSEDIAFDPKNALLVNTNVLPCRTGRNS
eukprot:3914059-Rhodomonas_salina.3